MGSNCCKGDAARPVRSSSSIYSRNRAGAALDDRFTSSEDTTGVRLALSAARTGDSGVYTLQASNAAGSDTSRVRLEVSAEEIPTGEDPPTFLRRLQDLTVKVGTRTRFLVEIVSSTECKVTWYRNERRLLEAERVSLARDGNFWCADVGAVSVDDAGRWTCTAENEGGRASCSAHLNVLVPKAYKRPEFVEELRALLTEQGTVSLECKVVGVPTPVLRWFKDSREIKAGDVFALTANADDPTSLGTYTCEAVNCMGRAYSSSKVHVVGRTSREASLKPSSSDLSPEPPPIFTKELEDYSIKISDPLTLSCHVVVPPWPRSVVWYNKEGKVEPGERYHALEDGVGGYLLEVSSAEWADEGEWKCVATSSGGRVGISTCYAAMEVPKNYRKPRFMENLQAVLTEEGLVSFECKVVGFPTPVLSWFKDGQELKPGDVYQLTGTNSLGSYCCIAKNCMGQASSSAELTVEDIQNQLNEEEKLQLFSKNQAPKFIQGLKSVEAKIDEPFRFTVKVGFPPEPSVVWYRDEQPVDESTRCHLGQEERGVFYLHIQTLEFLDQAEWKCVCLNDFGHSVTSCFLKLIIPRHYKKPRFLENLQAILSDEGAVNLECKVIGVPQPVLKWYKDGEELKPGDIHRIISGQDGTCCLGTYTCEAQNCMGIAASSASLLGFEDSMKAKAKKAEEQALQRNLSLSTIHEERTSQMYDTPVGDITLDDKGEISFSFDGKEVSVSLYETPDLTEEEALQIVEMYADQLSENVTEHNVVELPPLRFVKETSTSGNLLMEAIIIDVSPDYFASPEEDLRTEADVEDISIADENGPPLLSLDQDVEIAGEDYLEKTMALLSDQKSDIPAKLSRKKSDSQKSIDDFYSLSRDQSLSDEKGDDDTHMSESDLNSYESAKSSAKIKSKLSTGDWQKSSEPTKTIVHKDEPVLMPKQDPIEKLDVTKQPQILEVPVAVKPKRERRTSRSSRRSSSGSEKSISKSKEELVRLKAEIEQLPLKPTMSGDEFVVITSSVSDTLSKVIHDVQLIERDIILKSEFMSSAATASRSLEIISTLIAPLSEIHSIADAAKESANESKEVTITIFNSLPQPIKALHQSLTIIEKCIDMESDNKTLVKKTCVAFIETCGAAVQNVISKLTLVVASDYLQIENKIINEIDSLASEISSVIKFSADTIKARNFLSEASEIKTEVPSQKENHARNTQKAVFELKSPVYSLMGIIDNAEKGNVTELIKTPNSEVLLNDMSAPIQDLQIALEQVESLSISESNSNLPKYNTNIIEAVVEPILKLRCAFEQLSTENISHENADKSKEILSSIKQNLNEIFSQINSTEITVGKFDVLQSDNKLNVLQKMAQCLITLENNLPRLESIPEIQTKMNAFHKKLTKVLEVVIESNDAEKYFALMEICNAVNRINTSIKSVDPENSMPLASLSNALRIIQDSFGKSIFDSELNCSIVTGITDLLFEIQGAINKSEELSLQIESEHIQDFITPDYTAAKVTVVMEHIDNTIAAIDSIKTIETTQELKLALSPVLENICPILEEIKNRVAIIQESEAQHSEKLSDLSNTSIAQTLATPLCELNQNIIVLNQLLVENIESLKLNTDVISAVAEPLHELHTTLEIIQQDVISQYEDDMTPYEVNINMASAVQNIHSCIVMIQEQTGLEAVDEISTLEDISNIKSSADILPSDRLVLPAAEETEIEQSLPPLITTLPVSATAQALQLLNDHLTVLQTPEVVDALDSLSEVSDFSSLKSVVLGMEDLYNGIESILHPLKMEVSGDLGLTINLRNLAVIAQPLQELHHSLSILDTTDLPIHEDVIDLSMDKVHSVFRSIFEFKEHLDKCNQALLPAVDIISNTFEISSTVINLRKVCSNLKDIIEKAKSNSDDIEVHQIEEIEEIIETLLQETNVSKGIKVDQIKFITEKLFKKIVGIQEELLHFTSQPSTKLAQEAKLIEIVEEVENNIVVLQQYDFVDLSQVSDMSSCLSSHLAMEIESESLALMAHIVENAVNVVQDCNQETPVADMMIVEDFLKTCKSEITILKCLINKATSHKTIIRLLEEFNALQTLIIDFKSKSSHLKLTDDTSGCLETFLVHADDCIENIRNSLVNIIQSQSEMLFRKPIAKLLGIEKLKEKLQYSKDPLLFTVIDKLDSIFFMIQPLMINIENYIIQDLKQLQIITTTPEESAVTEKIDDLREFVEFHSTLTKTGSDTEHVLNEVSLCVNKHQEFRDVSGKAKLLIILKCLSECVDILDEENTEKSQESQVTTGAAKANILKQVLTEMLQPLQALQNQLENIRSKIISGVEDGSISHDFNTTESLVQTMTELHNNIVNQIESEKNDTQNENIPLIKQVDEAIHTIQDSVKSMENLEAAQAITKITKPMKNIDQSLQKVLNSEVKTPDKHACIKDKTADLLLHIDQYIDLIEIVEEISAVIQIENVEETINIARELKESISASQCTTESNIRDQIYTDQTRLALKLQKALIALQVQVFDSAQELAPTLSTEVLQRIAQVTAQLQADLVAVTGVQISIQAPLEILETVTSENTINETPSIEIETLQMVEDAKVEPTVFDQVKNIDETLTKIEYPEVSSEIGKTIKTETIKAVSGEYVESFENEETENNLTFVESTVLLPENVCLTVEELEKDEEMVSKTEKPQFVTHLTSSEDIMSSKAELSISDEDIVQEQIISSTPEIESIIVDGKEKLVEDIKDFISSDTVIELTSIVDLEQLKSGIEIAQELLGTISSMETLRQPDLGVTPLHQAKLIVKLKNAISVLHQQDMEVLQELAPEISKESFGKATEIVNNLYSDLSEMINSHPDVNEANLLMLTETEDENLSKLETKQASPRVTEKDNNTDGLKLISESGPEMFDDTNDAERSSELIAAIKEKASSSTEGTENIGLDTSESLVDADVTPKSLIVIETASIEADKFEIVEASESQSVKTTENVTARTEPDGYEQVLRSENEIQSIIDEDNPVQQKEQIIDKEVVASITDAHSDNLEKVTVRNDVVTSTAESAVKQPETVKVSTEKNMLVRHIEEFVAEDISEVVLEISKITNIDDLKESVTIAKELRDCILTIGSSVATEETSWLSPGDHAVEAKLTKHLQNALSTLHTQALESAKSITSLIKPEQLQKVSEIITQLQEDLITADKLNNYEMVQAVAIREESKQDTMDHLFTLLQDVNNTANDYSSSKNDENTETLKDTLDEVQTVIIKLKRDYDEALNETICETLDDLECSVRSVQLQINEESPSEHLKEACETLQLLANNMTTAQDLDMSENVSKCVKTQTILTNCSDESNKTLKLLDSASEFESNNNSNLTNIISKLRGLSDCLKSIRMSFLGDADTLIENGIDVIRYLDTMEEQVFDLDRQVEIEEALSPNDRDSILTAIHSVYGSISNMRGTISSVQKRYLFENYGQPAESLLRSIKNIAYIIAVIQNINKTENWKNFSKCIRNVLNHFEDIKFYINLDKTARLPSDSTFTTFILNELKTNISNVVITQEMCLNNNMMEIVSNALQCINTNLHKLEDQTSLEVKCKIPIFKDISLEVFCFTNVIKDALQQSSKILRQSLLKQQETDDTKQINESNILEFDSKKEISHDLAVETNLNNQANVFVKELGNENLTNIITQESEALTELPEIWNKQFPIENLVSKSDEYEDDKTGNTKLVTITSCLVNQALSDISIPTTSNTESIPNIDLLENSDAIITQKTNTKETRGSADNEDIENFIEIQSIQDKESVEVGIKLKEDDKAKDGEFKQQKEIKEEPRPVYELEQNNVVDLVGEVSSKLQKEDIDSLAERQSQVVEESKEFELLQNFKETATKEDNDMNLTQNNDDKTETSIENELFRAEKRTSVNILDNKESTSTQLKHEINAMLVKRYEDEEANRTKKEDKDKDSVDKIQNQSAQTSTQNVNIENLQVETENKSLEDEKVTDQEEIHRCLIKSEKEKNEAIITAIKQQQTGTQESNAILKQKEAGDENQKTESGKAGKLTEVEKQEQTAETANEKLNFEQKETESKKSSKDEKQEANKLFNKDELRHDIENIKNKVEDKKEEQIYKEAKTEAELMLTTKEIKTISIAEEQNISEEARERGMEKQNSEDITSRVTVNENQINEMAEMETIVEHNVEIAQKATMQERQEESERELKRANETINEDKAKTVPMEEKEQEVEHVAKEKNIEVESARTEAALKLKEKESEVVISEKKQDSEKTQKETELKQIKQESKGAVTEEIKVDENMTIDSKLGHKEQEASVAEMKEVLRQKEVAAKENKTSKVEDDLTQKGKEAKTSTKEVEHNVEKETIETVENKENKIINVVEDEINFAENTERDAELQQIEGKIIDAIDEYNKNDKDIAENTSKEEKQKKANDTTDALAKQNEDVNEIKYAVKEESEESTTEIKLAEEVKNVKNETITKEEQQAAKVLKEETEKRNEDNEIDNKKVATKEYGKAKNKDELKGKGYESKKEADEEKQTAELNQREAKNTYGEEKETTEKIIINTEETKVKQNEQETMTSTEVEEKLDTEEAKEKAAKKAFISEETQRTMMATVEADLKQKGEEAKNTIEKEKLEKGIAIIESELKQKEQNEKIKVEEEKQEAELQQKKAKSLMAFEELNRESKKEQEENKAAHEEKQETDNARNETESIQTDKTKEVAEEKTKKDEMPKNEAEFNQREPEVNNIIEGDKLQSEKAKKEPELQQQTLKIKKESDVKEKEHESKQATSKKTLLKQTGETKAAAAENTENSNTSLIEAELHQKEQEAKEVIENKYVEAKKAPKQTELKQEEEEAKDTIEKDKLHAEKAMKKPELKQKEEESKKATKKDKQETGITTKVTEIIHTEKTKEVAEEETEMKETPKTEVEFNQRDQETKNIIEEEKLLTETAKKEPRPQRKEEGKTSFIEETQEAKDGKSNDTLQEKKKAADRGEQETELAKNEIKIKQKEKISKKAFEEERQDEESSKQETELKETEKTKETAIEESEKTATLKEATDLKQKEPEAKKAIDDKYLDAKRAPKGTDLKQQEAETKNTIEEEKLQAEKVKNKPELKQKGEKSKNATKNDKQGTESTTKVTELIQPEKIKEVAERKSEMKETPKNEAEFNQIEQTAKNIIEEEKLHTETAKKEPKPQLKEEAKKPFAEETEEAKVGKLNDIKQEEKKVVDEEKQEAELAKKEIGLKQKEQKSKKAFEEDKQDEESSKQETELKETEKTKETAKEESEKNETLREAADLKQKNQEAKNTIEAEKLQAEIEKIEPELLQKEVGKNALKEEEQEANIEMLKDKKLKATKAADEGKQDTYHATKEIESKQNKEKRDKVYAEKKTEVESDKQVTDLNQKEEALKTKDTKSLKKEAELKQKEERAKNAITEEMLHNKANLKDPELIQKEETKKTFEENEKYDVESLNKANEFKQTEETRQSAEKEIEETKIPKKEAKLKQNEQGAKTKIEEDKLQAEKYKIEPELLQKEEGKHAVKEEILEANKGKNKKQKEKKAANEGKQETEHAIKEIESNQNKEKKDKAFTEKTTEVKKDKLVIDLKQTEEDQKTKETKMQNKEVELKQNEQESKNTIEGEKLQAEITKKQLEIQQKEKEEKNAITEETQEEKSKGKLKDKKPEKRPDIENQEVKNTKEEAELKQTEETKKAAAVKTKKTKIVNKEDELKQKEQKAIKEVKGEGREPEKIKKDEIKQENKDEKKNFEQDKIKTEDAKRGAELKVTEETNKASAEKTRTVSKEDELIKNKQESKKTIEEEKLENEATKKEAKLKQNERKDVEEREPEAEKIKNEAKLKQKEEETKKLKENLHEEVKTDDEKNEKSKKERELKQITKTAKKEAKSKQKDKEESRKTLEGVKLEDNQVIKLATIELDEIDKQLSEKTKSNDQLINIQKQEREKSKTEMHLLNNKNDPYEQDRKGDSSKLRETNKNFDQSSPKGSSHTESSQMMLCDSDQHYIKEYQYEPSSSRISKYPKEKPIFVDHNHKDYAIEFARPANYRERSFDIFDRSSENQSIHELGNNATIYKAQTIIRDAQLRLSTSPYPENSRSGEPGYRKTDIRHRSKALSEVRSVVSEKGSGISRDSKKKPVFSTYLTDRTAVEGSRVKLTCSILSSIDPSITWYRNGVLLDNKLKYKTKNVEGLITLEVLNAATSDSAEYTCTVENKNGSVSSSATLKVYPSFEASPIPPTFTRSIRDMYHMAENELVLECRIRGQPLPTITWLKDDKPIVSDERFQAYYLADGVCRLAIESPTPDDSGKYTCKAENSVWSDQITHVVTFTGKERRLSPNITTIAKSRFNRQSMESRRPHFTNVLTDYKVAKGGTIGLQVEIRGAPTNVEWLREGRCITEVYRNAKTYVEQGLYTLALTDVTEKESGMYTCRAWSTHGNVDMNAAITVVQPNELEGRPAIIVGRPDKDILISVGEDVNISFRVQGEPKPKVIFMKGIRDITTSQRVCKMTSDDYVKFTLKRSVISDAGTYCILVRNAYGCDRAFVTVVVRQRASSDNLITDWTYPADEASVSTTDRNYKSVPERIPGEPTVVDGGSNWVSLSWAKPEPGVTAPVLAFRVDSWLLGKEGGARWVELGITPLNSFDAFNLKQGEEYHFRVTPRNRYGWGESVQTSRPVAIGLTGDRPEFIDILPGQLKVLAGETANLNCSVKGKPTPEVIWMKNGHDIEEEDERVSITYNGLDCGLTIKDISIEDEARYSCEATNDHGRTSTYARLAVVTDRMIWEADAKLKRERSAGAEGEFPPQFTMRLRDRRVQATYPVRLTCQVVGSPPPTLTWYKDGQEVESDSRRCQSQDEHFHTLEIAPTALEDGGVYEALARNSRGAVSCRCSLIVDKGIRAYVAPEFCCGLEPLYRVSDGEELRISAVVEAYPSVGVTWYRDGVRLRPSRRAVMTLDHDGQIELALAAVTPRDAGVYTCTASNEVGRASTSGKVEIIGGDTQTKNPPLVLLSPDAPYSKEPMFIRKPRSSSAQEGDTVIIQCEVVGDPKPDVYWLRDFLKPDYYRDSSHFRRVGLGSEYRFEIPHAKLDYTGAYSVVARNVHGEAKAVISLQILAKDLTSNEDVHNVRYGEVEVLPRFEKELTDLLSCDGDAVEFECRVSGHPEPDINWFHYHELIRESEDFEWTFKDGSARLKIRQVTAEDEGTYSCEAANSLGKAASSACLVVYPAGEPNTLCQRLRRPPELLSAVSTPRSTPRTTPARSLSRARTPGPDSRRLCSPARQMAPTFYTYPFNKVAEEGDTVTLQCAVKGLPAPWATWDKDGVIITPSSRITLKEKDEIFRILEIEQVTVDDVGVYRITVENEFGRAEASARIEVITQRGKFYGGVRAYSPSPRRSLTYRSRRPSTPSQD